VVMRQQANHNQMTGYDTATRMKCPELPYGTMKEMTSPV
ncbi:MAG: hypothetical protein K0R28_5246, partial [Paenibacillus sp.]|nr:hypothetical protein [Paenibacillus sp.]